MKRKLYYFVIHSGNYNQCMSEYTHWACSNEFSSKAALKKSYTHGRQSVKANEIYTLEQMVEKFSNHYRIQIANEIKRMCSCVYIKED